MAKPVITVLGSSGQVGSAIVHSLSSLHSDKVLIKACTRHPEKAFGLVNLPAVEVIQADMGASDIVEIIKPFNSASAFIVTPGDNENTAAIVGRAAQSCKAAGVQNVAVISDGFADVADSCIFGRQAKAVEQVIKETGISYTILRLPYFYENLQLKASVIRENSASGYSMHS
jgi:NAD(P)H dehydrogenase (quinone)